MHKHFKSHTSSSMSLSAKFNMDSLRQIIFLLTLKSILWNTSETAPCEISFNTESSSAMLLPGDGIGVLCDASCFENDDDTNIVWLDPSRRHIDALPKRIFTVPYNGHLLNKLVIIDANLDDTGTYMCSVRRSGQLLQQIPFYVFVSDFGDYDHSRRKRDTNTTYNLAEDYNNSSASADVAATTSLPQVTSEQTASAASEDTTVPFTTDVESRNVTQVTAGDQVTEDSSFSPDPRDNASTTSETENPDDDTNDEDETDEESSDEDESSDDDEEGIDGKKSGSCLHEGEELSTFGKYGVITFAVCLAVAFLLFLVMVVILIRPGTLATGTKKATLQHANYRAGGPGGTNLAPMLVLYDAEASDQGHDIGNPNAIDLDQSLISESDDEDPKKDEDSEDASASVSTFLLRRESQKNAEDKMKNSQEEKDDDKPVVLEQKTHH